MSTQGARCRHSRTLTIAVLVATATASVGAASATAATQTSPTSKGKTSASVVQLALGLPGIGSLGVGDPVTLSLIGVAGASTTSASGPDASTALAKLGSGSLVDSLLSPLAQTNTATLANPSPDSKTAASAPANPVGLSLGVGTLNAAVTKATAGNFSSGTLAKVGLGTLSSLPGAAALINPLQTNLSAAATSVTTALTPLVTAINALPVPLSTIPAIVIPNPLVVLVPGSPATVTAPSLSLTDLTTQVNGLPAAVTALINQILNGPLVTIDSVHALQTIHPSATDLISSAETTVGAVGLLGGTFTLNGVSSKAVAVATGKSGVPLASAGANLLTLTVTTGAGSKLGDLLSVILNAQGLTATVAADSALSQPVKDLATALNTQLTALLAQVNNLTGLLGVAVKQSTANATTSPDGTHSEAHASGSLVTVTLPTTTVPAFSMRVGAADATADFAAVPAAASSSSPGSAPKTPKKTLAFTGSSPGLTLVALTFLVIGAAGLAHRRRLTAACSQG